MDIVTRLAWGWDSRIHAPDQFGKVCVGGGTTRGFGVDACWQPLEAVSLCGGGGDCGGGGGNGCGAALQCRFGHDPIATSKQPLLNLDTLYPPTPGFSLVPTAQRF